MAIFLEKWLTNNRASESSMRHILVASSLCSHKVRCICGERAKFVDALTPLDGRTHSSISSQNSDGIMENDTEMVSV